MEDSYALLQVDSAYRPDQWASDIESGWDFFKENISTRILNTTIYTEKSSNSLGPSGFFPPRLLTKSEQSVAMRHILAIKATARSNIPCIILEDDALIGDQALFHELIHYLRDEYKNRVFFDLTDNYIPLNVNHHKKLSTGNLHFCIMPIAITRTLMAYAISPEIARALLESLSCYSLPIDMQLQVSLSRLLLPGMSLINSPFIHGSKNNAITSSVLQH
ncbi:glycosyltransferase family 25 protein [Synechococcus sp. UW179B]|uniref:glycosyltransferase family 25 protein n=1 Tax=Synechococcus sp. UW179B TaxID=2575516 RepID=UPI001482E3E1|nr:glycosyltransferase family 25 protein [Synechococcus sp. UW179B]